MREGLGRLSGAVPTMSPPVKIPSRPARRCGVRGAGLPPWRLCRLRRCEDLKRDFFVNGSSRVRRFVPNGILLDSGAASGSRRYGTPKPGSIRTDRVLRECNAHASPRRAHASTSATLRPIRSIPTNASTRRHRKFDIIESSRAPVELLRISPTLLSTGGLLVLTTPDIRHFLRYLMDQR